MNIRQLLKVNSKKFLKVNKKDIGIILGIAILCFGTIRNGHENFTVRVTTLIILSIIVALAFNLKIRAKSYGKELYAFIIVALAEIPIQYGIYYGTYYGLRSALWCVFTLILMVFCVSILVQNRKGLYIWNIINIVNILNSTCVILQILFRVLGLDINRYNFLTEVFFKSYEFRGGALFRASGMFSEPSHFAEIGLLSLFFYLFININYKKATYVCVALILSTSSLGIIGSVLLIILHVLNIDKLSGIKKWMKQILLVITTIILLFLYWWSESTTNVVMQRVFDGGTATVRVFRAFEVFLRLDLFEKLFGIGLQNLELFLNWGRIKLSTDTVETMTINREFAQNFGYILCTTGVIGLISFIFPFYRIGKKENAKVKSFLVIFLFMSLTCCNLTRISFLLYLLAFFSLIDLNHYDIVKKNE